MSTPGFSSPYNFFDAFTSNESSISDEVRFDYLSGRDETGSHDFYRRRASRLSREEVQEDELELRYKSAILRRQQGAITEALNNIRSSNEMRARLFGAYTSIFDEPSRDRAFSEQLRKDMIDHLLDRETDDPLLPEYNYFKTAIDFVEMNSIVDAERFRRNTFSTYSIINRIGNLKSVRRVLDNTSFVARPGIAPAALLIQTAKVELSFDIYQLQNPAIQDLLTIKIIDKVKEYRDSNDESGREKFRLNVRLALPDSGDSTSAAILGPNILFYRRLRILGELFKGDIDIKFLEGHSGNHPKIIASEDYLTLSSQNLTAPVGKSIYQGGANYEAMRILHFSGGTKDNLDEEMKRDLLRIIREGRDEDILKEIGNKLGTTTLSAEQKLFLQAKIVLDRNMRTGAVDLRTGMDNIGGPQDTREHLNSLLDYVGLDSNRRMDFILDQPGFLAPFRQGEISDIKEKVTRLLVGNRSTVIMDVRNYRQQVVDPVFSKLRENPALLVQFGYNLNDLVSALSTGSEYEDRVTSLLSNLQQKGYKDANRDLAVSLLAITSGNVIQSIVPRQHAKAYHAYEVSDGGIRTLGTKQGSSNPSMRGLGISEKSNYELDLLLMLDEVRGLSAERSPLSLSNNEVEEQLLLEANAFRLMQSDLGFNSSIRYNDVNNAAQWERNVDHLKLEELYQSLKSLNSQTRSQLGGREIFKVSYNYRGGNPISVLVSVDPNAFGAQDFVSETKIKFEFTVAKTGASAKFKGNSLNNLSSESANPLVLEVRKSKIVGFTEVINRSNTALHTGFIRGDQPLVIPSNYRDTLSPIESAVSLVSSLTYQAANKIFIEAPRTHLAYVSDSPGAMFDLVSRYILKLSNKSHLHPSDILDPQKITSSDLRLVANRFYSRFTTDISGVGMDYDLRGVRDVAGINRSDPNRVGTISSIAELIEVLAQVEDRNTRGLLLGLPVSGRTIDRNITSEIESLLMSPDGMYADVLYDMVSGAADSMYRRELRQALKDNISKIFSAYIMPTQNRVYSTTQGARRRVITGYTNNSNIEKVNEGGTGLRGLLPFSALMNPLPYNTSTYFGRGSRSFVREVAGGGGPSPDIRAEDDLYSGYKGYVGGSRVNKIGTETGIEIIQDANVGMILNRQSPQQYLDTVTHLINKYGANNINLKALEHRLADSDSDLLIFNFDRVKKVAQIPQRIKNVIGSKILLDLTEEYQALLEFDLASEGANKIKYYSKIVNNVQLSGKGIGETEVSNVTELQDAYLRDIVDNLKSLGIEGDALYKRLFQEGYGVGALFSNKLKPFLSRDLAFEYEMLRKELIDEYFKGEDLFADRDEAIRNAANEMLRAKLLIIDTESSGMKGFLGSSRRTGDPTMLFQLSGAYSDPFFANPDFGSVDRDGRPSLRGLRQGYIDRAVKKIKASHLATSLENGIVSWHLGENVKLTAGDIIAFNDAQDQSWIYRIENGKRVKVGSVDSRSQVKLMTNIIESRGEVPIMAFNTATSANVGLIGEHGRESIRSIRILNGNPETGEISVEINYDRTLLPGAGRREEGSGLFKGVPIYIEGAMFPDLVENWNLQRAKQYEKLASAQVRGLISMSNLKSYFFEHGSVLLTQNKGKNLEKLINNIGSPQLAASILMSMGDPHERVQISQREEIGRLLVEGIESGQFGSALKSKFTLYQLQKGSRSRSKEFYEDVYKEFVASTDKTAKLQMPALGLIDGNDLISALRGENSILKDKVRDILRDDSNKILNLDSGYLIVDTLRGREMASLAAGIDLMNDFFNSSTINLPIIGDLEKMMGKTASLESKRQAQIMMKQLGIAANLTTEEIMSIENGEITDLGLLVHKIASNSHLLRLYISTSASQSKVPLSSKMTANIELQHIVSESFTINTEVFKRGGVVDQLRKIMATVLGSMVGSGGDFMLTATEKMDLVDLTSPRGRDPFFKSQMLGVYVNEIESTSASNSIMKNRYEAFHTLLMLNTREGNYAQQMKSFIETNKGIREDDAFKGLIPFIDNIIAGGETDSYVMEIEASILKELSEMKSGIRESFERWAYFSDKAMNIEAAEAMMRGMMDSKRFAFSVPKFERIGGFVRFYKDKKEYGLALSGQDIALVGPQYGEFMSEIMSDTKEIWMAMAEGSIVNEIFNKVSKGFLESDSSTYDTILSEEEFRYLDSFYQVVRALPQNIVKASSGKRAQKLLGAKMPIEGATFTGAASWYMPHGRVVLPEESRRRYGAHPSLTRIAAFKKIRSRTHNLSDSIKGIQDELDYLSDYSHIENNWIPRDILNFEKQLAVLRNERSILVYQNAMIATKLSPGASDRLTKLIGDSERITGLLKSQRDVSSISSIIDNIDEQIEEVTSLRIGKKDKADYYIRLLALQELTVLKGVALQMRGVGNEEESQVLEKAKRYLKLGSVVSGLTVSTEVKFAADALFQEQANEVLGEIRRRKIPLISPDELRTPFKRNSNNSARLGLEEAITNQATGRKAVKNLIGWVERARKDYIKRANEFDLSESLVKAFRTTLNRLEGINQNIQDKSFSVESLKLDLQVEMSELFTEMSLSSVLAWRSPPPGSHSLLRSLFRSMDLGELDQHVRNMLGTNQSNVPLVAFTPKGDRPNRNRTLGMFNPITYMVTQGGDWDGDSISAIFDYSVIARAEIFDRQQKIKELRSQIIKLRTNLRTTGNDTPKREQIEEEIAVLRNQIDQLSKAKRIREQTLKENESRYGASEIRKAAVEWVGNYIGIDNRIFLGIKYGGWSSENRGEGVDFESLMVFVEKGRGLVGGMENVFSNEDVREGQGINIKTTLSDLLQLVTRTEDLQSSDSFNARLLSEPDLELASKLASNETLRETIRTGILDLHSRNLQSDENYSIKKSIIEYAAGLSAGQKGMSNLSNFFGRAYGTSIGADEFELMLNVIGQAGSSVLGKTYNATIGLLYNQSPLLALSNLILNDEQVIEYVRRMQGDDQLNRMQMEAREARNTSKRVGGLLQTVNQIMRDSFKPKDNSQQFLDNLASKIQEIHRAKDDKERVKIIESISSEFGPGSGLRALMNIESLVKNLYLFSNETSNEEILEAQKAVLEEMGVSSKKEKDISRILGFEAEEVRGETQFSGYGRRPLVAAYKTKSDLISISAAFIVERNFNDRGSSYRELMSKFRKGFLDAPENLIGDEGIKLRRSTLELAGLFRDGLSEADRDELSRIGDSPTVRSNFTLSRAIRRMQEGLLSSRADLTEDDRLRFEYGEFLKSLAYHKGDSFSELSKDSLFTQYSSMSPEEKALVAHTFLETRDKIHAFSGDMGQDLLRFAEYDYNRRDAYNNRFLESPTDPGWDLPKVSMEQARWQAIVSGKVGPDMIAQFLAGSINVAKYSKNGAISEGDILRDMMRPGLINTGWSGESTPTNNFLENMRMLTKDEEFTELILGKVRQTAFGSSASTFTDMARGVLTSAETRDPKIINKLTEAGLEVEDARRVYDDYIRAYTQTVGTDELIDTSILYSSVKNAGVRRAPSPPEAVVSGAFRATGANSDIASEAFLFPAIALIGQAIANGSVDPETVQASIGNSFSALIYNRPFLSKAGGIATNMLAGTGYKMRFISQSEDFGKELVSTVARELTIAATTGIFTEPVSRGLTSLMGQRPSFDIDELEGMRSFAAATVSMISTGILATFLGNQVYRRVRNYEPSQIEQKIKALNKEKSNIQNKAEEAEVDIETDNGIVQYEVSYSFSTDPMANVATHEAIVNVDNGFQESLDGDFYEGYSVSL